MKKSIIIITILQVFFSPSWAQSLRGFYTGQLKLSGPGIIMSVQMDLLEDEGMISGVLRFRAVEDNQLSGCDNWVSGQKSGNRIRLQNLVALKETNIASWVCNDYKWLDMSLTKSSTESTPDFKGNLTDKNGRNFATITLTRIDTANSISVSEERDEAIYRLGERQIAMAVEDSTRIGLMLSYRGVQWLDSLEIGKGPASILVKAPTADRFHKLTILINNSIVMLNTSPAQKATNIKLEELDETELDIILVCDHTLVSVNYFVTLTLTYAGGEKEWEIPVSTYKNRAIKLKIVDKSIP